MQQASKPLAAPDLPISIDGLLASDEQLVPLALMISLQVIMLDEFSESAAKRLLAEEDHAPQALVLYRADESAA